MNPPPPSPALSLRETLSEIGNAYAMAWNERVTAAARQRTRRVQGKEP